MVKISDLHSPVKTKLINGKEVKNAFRPKAILPKNHPDYKLALSDKAKLLGKDIKSPQITESKPLNSTPIEASPVEADPIDISVELPKVPTPDVPNPADLLDTADKLETVKKTSKVVTKAESASIEKPAVFFIGGLRVLDFDLLEDGMKSMTEAVDEGRYYGWDQKSEMIDEIKTRKSTQPVILVGHGFGADTAMEIAQDLNTLENKFRTVDLLVTLNSIGVNNDFVPQNVLTNKNYLTADNGFLDDGPNIALNYKTTKVENFLRPEDHSDLDETVDIQREVMQEIDRLIK